jgi:hypothetical protein
MAAETPPDYATWLPVIGRSLAYLCLDVARRREPEKYREVLDKVARNRQGHTLPTDLLIPSLRAEATAQQLLFLLTHSNPRKLVFFTINHHPFHRDYWRH